MPSTAEARFSIDENVGLVDGTPSFATRFSIDEEVTDFLGSASQYLYVNPGFVVLANKDAAQHVYENVGFVVIPSHDGAQYVYANVVDAIANLPLGCVPMPHSIHVYLNGIEQREDVDWVWSEVTNMVIVLQDMQVETGDLLEALYACADPDIGDYTPPPVDPDITAPTTPGVSVGTVTVSSVTINWTASYDSIGVVGYEVLLDSGVWTQVGNVLTYTFTGLAPGTLHTFSVRAYDAAGNRSGIGSATATTGSTADATPPTTPGSFTVGAVTSYTIPTTWTTSTDSFGVLGYEVQVGSGAWMNVGITTSYTFSGLDASTAYTVRVRAFDAAGNRSSSASASTTTLAAPGGGGGTPDYYGWTAPPRTDNTYANYTVPPEFPSGIKPFHDKTGVFDATRRAALTTYSGDYHITANNQLVHDLKITGKLITGSYTGAKIFFCEVQKGTDSSISTATGAPDYVYCDLGNGATGDMVINTRGGANFYRCNSFGYLDGPSPAGTSGTFYVRDTFVHSNRYCTDQGQGLNEPSHNDCCQPKGNGAIYELVNNVYFGWTIYNYNAGGTKTAQNAFFESCTRSSSPHWYDTRGRNDATPTSGNPWGGYMTSVFLLGTNYSNSKANMRRCDFRGDANQYIVMRGAGGVVQDCRFSSNEQALSYRPNCIFNESYFDSVTGNVYGPWDPRAGQPIVG